MALASGQGPCAHADRDASGNPVNFAWFGNAPTVTLSLGVTTVDHRDSYTGTRTTDARIITENTARVQITTDDFKEANAVLATFGAATAITGSSVTNEAVLSTVPVVGERYFLQATGRVSALTLKGNAVTIPTTKYTVDASGVIVFSDVSGIAAPITADYTVAASRQVGFFKTAPPERYIRQVILNTATSVSGDYARAVLELFKVRMNPVEDLGLINNEFMALTLNGAALIDEKRTAASATGQFGRIIYFDAV
jgi:hypothetical protein